MFLGVYSCQVLGYRVIMSEQQQTSTKVVGFILIAIGLYLLVGLFAHIPFSGILLQYWPVVLVLLGPIMMIGSPEKATTTAGAVITIVGLLALGLRLGVTNTDTGQAIFNLLIVLLGLMVLMNVATPSDKK